MSGRGPRRIYATDAQEVFIRRLRREAAALLAKTEWLPTDRRLLRSEADAEIKMLLRAVKAARGAA